MHYGELLTPENLTLFLCDADGHVWRCTDCEQLFHPRQVRENLNIPPLVRYTKHECLGGKEGTLEKMTLRDYLSRYKFSYE